MALNPKAHHQYIVQRGVPTLYTKTTSILETPRTPEASFKRFFFFRISSKCRFNSYQSHRRPFHLVKRSLPSFEKGRVVIPLARFFFVYNLMDSIIQRQKCQEHCFHLRCCYGVKPQGPPPIHSPKRSPYPIHQNHEHIGDSKDT